MSEERFGESKQNKLKGLSKAIYIIAKIEKILITIGITIAVLAVIVALYLVTNIEINNNTISLNNYDKKIEIIESKDNKEMILKFGEQEINVTREIKGDMDKDLPKVVINEFMRNLNKTTKVQRISYVSVISIMMLANLVLARFIVVHIEKLFKNIKDEETPFTIENAKHLKNIAYLIIALIATPLILMSIAEMIIKLDTNINISLSSVIAILSIFALSYIFEYGAEIQKDSKLRINK